MPGQDLFNGPTHFTLYTHSLQLDLQTQTNMFSLQRSFSVNPAVLTSGHPYPFHPLAQSGTVQFIEFRGTGPPSTNFGQAGDVYVDLTPRLHALYWRERDTARGGAGQWRKWTALLLDKVPLHRFLVPHPWARSAESSNLYLWADPGGVTWTSKDNICASRVHMIQSNIAAIPPGTIPDVEVLVSEILHRMLDAERRAASAARGSPPHKRGRSPPSSQYVEQYSGARSSVRSFQTYRPYRNLVHAACMGAQTHTLLPPLFPNDSGSRSSSFRSNPYPYPINQLQPSTTEERYHAAQIALDAMRRAQDAEVKSKQELKQKSRQLATLRQKEKEVIGMSYHYQKREQELVAALAAAKQRSSAELDEMRTAVHALKRQAAAAQQETQHTVAQIQSSQEELAATQREIQKLHSLLAQSSEK
ncbi:hypothetical protein B0H14DRAFT_2852298 [Mycena olivaceomarginata]|nr:hypothetical protein B0H14DRAFT_2852298 [Mycena olivaceomarginata]